MLRAHRSSAQPGERHCQIGEGDEPRASGELRVETGTAEMLRVEDDMVGSWDDLMPWFRWTVGRTVDAESSDTEV